MATQKLAKIQQLNSHDIVLTHQFNEFKKDSSHDNHMKREFCSELIQLPVRIQQEVLEIQDKNSLKLLADTLMQYKRIHTGEFTYPEEIDLVKTELARKKTFKKEPLSKANCKKLEQEIMEYLNKIN